MIRPCISLEFPYAAFFGEMVFVIAMEICPLQLKHTTVLVVDAHCQWGRCALIGVSYDSLVLVKLEKQMYCDL